MFGYVQANLKELNEPEKQRYFSAYCGLCHALGRRHGFLARFALTYDLTFLALLLSSLYEPKAEEGRCRCCVHPCRKHAYAIDSCTEYAADMTIALTYHKCLDDWNDDRNLLKKWYAALLKPQYQKVKQQYPTQCSLIEQTLAELSALEQKNIQDPDGAANCFGRLMEGLFLYQKDRWETPLRTLGYGLGQYIYLADAAVDLEEDRRKNRYNPLKELSASPADLRPTLMMVLGKASDAFEQLPLVQDLHLLRNIFYSGIWLKYTQEIQKKEKVKS